MDDAYRKFVDKQFQIREEQEKLATQKERDRVARIGEFRMKIVRKWSKGTGKTPEKFMAEMPLEIIKAVELMAEVAEIKLAQKMGKKLK